LGVQRPSKRGLGGWSERENGGGGEKEKKKKEEGSSTNNKQFREGEPPKRAAKVAEAHSKSQGRSEGSILILKQLKQGKKRLRREVSGKKDRTIA